MRASSPESSFVGSSPVGMIAWWSSTFASATTRASGSTSRPATYRAAARYVAGLDVLPLARVVADAKVDDHHAIIPTGELPTKELSGDDARIYELVVRRFLAVFHPEAKFEDTEIVTVAAEHRFRTRGHRLIEAGWRGAAFGEEA